MTSARSGVRVIAMGLALGLIACGEGRSGTEPEDRPADPAALEIVATEYRLDPATVRAPRAGSVVLRFVNEGQIGHALAVDGPQGERRTGSVAPGASSTLRLALPEGTYKLSCPLSDHEARGMVAHLRVAE